MDGNRRWAKENNLANVTEGHRVGADRLEEIVEECGNLGIKYLTVYTFSTENFKRGASELKMLFDLFVDFALNKRKKLMDKGVQVKLLGKVDMFPKFVVQAMEKLLSDTKDGTGLILNLCFGYGGRAEIVDACRKILDAGVKAEKLSEELFEKHLYTVGMPDVDVMVRTGGAMRVSNFLPWQISYAEMFFVDKYWPEFTKRELHKVLKEFEERERRFGK
jgi:undecaprenyl diphosphate synthase